MSQDDLLEEIRNDLDTKSRYSDFGISGSIGVTNTSTQPATALNTIPYFRPIQLRFGSNGLGNTLDIPGSDTSSKEFKKLLSLSQPTTSAPDGFYRKVGKLDRGQFATDFCPYAAGIVYLLTQKLLPQNRQSKQVRSINVW
jgi:hypothetical protein